MSAILKHSEERLMKVLLAPVISEKATMVAEKNEQIVFRVLPDATKPEIKAAVELPAPPPKGIRAVSVMSAWHCRPRSARNPCASAALRIGPFGQ